MPCVVTVGEIRALAARRGWGQEKVDRMARLLDDLVWVDISDPEVLDAYVHVDAARPRGWEMADNDRWIAAAAHATSACLLTTDTDFDVLAGTLIERELIDQTLGREA